MNETDTASYQDLSGDQQHAMMQRELESHKVEVSHMKIDRTTQVGGIMQVGGATRHDTGGEAARPYLGNWVRERSLGGGNFGEVYLERNSATRMVRAVKKLTGGKPAWHDREIRQMLMLKSVCESSRLWGIHG